MSLEPNVREMLNIGKGCGLKTLEGAYSNYLNHYDCFFLIAKYPEQIKAFNQEIRELGLIGEKYLLKISIDEALEKL